MTQMTVLRPEQIGNKGVIIKGERNALIGCIANWLPHICGLFYNITTELLISSLFSKSLYKFVKNNKNPYYLHNVRI